LASLTRNVHAAKLPAFQTFVQALGRLFRRFRDPPVKIGVAGAEPRQDCRSLVWRRAAGREIDAYVVEEKPAVSAATKTGTGKIDRQALKQQP